MYRMALDIIPASSKEMRYKILKNIGVSFVKLGKCTYFNIIGIKYYNYNKIGSFHDAISTYENIMKGGADFQTAFNLLLCLYA